MKMTINTFYSVPGVLQGVPHYNLQSGAHLLVLQEPPAVQAASPHQPHHAYPEDGEESAELS